MTTRTKARPKWTPAPDYQRVSDARMKGTGLWIEGVPMPKAYGCNGLYALVGYEPVGRLGDGTEDMRWHISINGAAAQGGPRLPDWYEMTEAAHQLRPGVTFVVGVPPRSWWMTDIESGRYVLHLWQMKDPVLERNWMDQRTPGGRAPS